MKQSLNQKLYLVFSITFCLVFMLFSFVIKPNASASETEEVKLLYTVDFSSVPIEYLDPTEDYISPINAKYGGSTDSNSSSFGDWEIVKINELKSHGWSNVWFNVGHHDSVRFFNRIGGTFKAETFYTNTESKTHEEVLQSIASGNSVLKEDTGLFYMVFESRTSMSKVKQKNDRYLKFYVDPVSYYCSELQPNGGGGDYVDIYNTSFDTIRLDNSNPGVAINGRFYSSENGVCVVSLDSFDDGEIISLERRAIGGGIWTKDIYKIEMYGVDESPALITEEPFSLKILFSAICGVVFVLLIVYLIQKIKYFFRKK